MKTTFDIISFYTSRSTGKRFTLTEKQKKGIDMVVNILKKKRPYIFGWELSDETEKYSTLLIVDLYVDQNTRLSDVAMELISLSKFIYNAIPETYQVVWLGTKNQYRVLKINVLN
jgi:hypothetical protein